MSRKLLLGVGFVVCLLAALPGNVASPFLSRAEAGVKSIEKRALRKKYRQDQRKIHQQKRSIARERRQEKNIKRALKKSHHKGGKRKPRRK